MSKNLHFDESTNTLTVGSVEGVVYTIGGKPVEGDIVLDKDTVVRAIPAPGYVFTRGVETEFKFEISKDIPDVDPDEDEPTEENTSPDFVVDDADDFETGNRQF